VLVEGFSNAENWATWSEGGSSVIRFKLARDVNFSELEATFTVSPLIAGPRKSFAAEVYFGGRLVALGDSMRIRVLKKGLLDFLSAMLKMVLLRLR
jgi:hypothetical protein